jgi:hypothetical protein
MPRLPPVMMITWPTVVPFAYLASLEPALSAGRGGLVSFLPAWSHDPPSPPPRAPLTPASIQFLHQKFRRFIVPLSAVESMGLLPATVTMEFNAVATPFSGALLAVCLQPSHPLPLAPSSTQIADVEGNRQAKLGIKKWNEAQDLTPSTPPPGLHPDGRLVQDLPDEFRSGIGAGGGRLSWRVCQGRWSDLSFPCVFYDYCSQCWSETWQGVPQYFCQSADHQVSPGGRETPFHLRQGAFLTLMTPNDNPGWGHRGPQLRGKKIQKSLSQEFPTYLQAKEIGAYYH